MFTILYQNTKVNKSFEKTGKAAKRFRKKSIPHSSSLDIQHSRSRITASLIKMLSGVSRKKLSSVCTSCPLLK